MKNNLESGINELVKEATQPSLKVGDVYETDNNRWGKGEKRNYKVVDKIGKDYHVWNIGDNFDKLKEGYIPLTKIKEGTYDIIPESLQTIYVGKDNADLLSKASAYGYSNADRINKLMKSLKDDKKRELAQKALDVFNQYKA